MINLALFGKEVTENRIKAYVFTMLLMVLAVVIIFLYGPTRNFIDNVDLSYYVDAHDLAFVANYDNYAWSQWTAKTLLQLGTLAAIVLGMGAVSGEVAYGTGLFLVSKPISRREIYTTKAAAGLFLLAVLVFVPTLLFILVSALKGFPLDYGPFLTATLINFSGAAIIYLGTAIFSTLLHEPVRAGVCAALFWLVVSVPGYFTATAPYSFFFQMKAIDFWIRGHSPIVPLGMALVLGGALYEAGVWLWSRQEF